MTHKRSAILLTLALMAACAGCGGTPEVTEAANITVVADTTEADDLTRETHLETPLEEPTEIPVENPEVTETAPEPTEAPAAFTGGRVGTFILDSSGQFSSCICRLKQMDSALVLFELDIMKGSEETNQVSNEIIAGVMILNEQGTEGSYSAAPDAEIPLAIQFSFDADGSGFTVTAPEDSSFTANGHYTLTGDTIEASEKLAVVLIEQLPTAATSLNGNLGSYTIECTESEAYGGSYQVNAVFDDTGSTLASFVVPMDLSCVIRMDADPEPMLIWGSAERMPDV